MSHTVSTQVQFRKVHQLVACAKALGYEVQMNGSVKFFDGKVRQGIVITIPGWRYPVVVNGTTVHSDTYEGKWGDEDQFNLLKQRYSEAVALDTYANEGIYPQSRTEVDGEIEIELEV